MSTTDQEKEPSAADIKRAEEIKVLLDRWIKKKSIEINSPALPEEDIKKVNKLWKNRGQDSAIRNPF